LVNKLFIFSITNVYFTHIAINGNQLKRRTWFFRIKESFIMELNPSQTIMCRKVDLSDKQCPDSDCSNKSILGFLNVVLLHTLIHTNTQAGIDATLKYNLGSEGVMSCLRKGVWVVLSGVWVVLGTGGLGHELSRIPLRPTNKQSSVTSKKTLGMNIMIDNMRHTVVASKVMHLVVRVHYQMVLLIVLK